MKIAVTYENGTVFQHFGHSEHFKLYEIENNEIKSSLIVGADGYGHHELAGFLKQQKVDTLLCGGIGGGAIAALSAAGIRIYAGCKGSADEAVSALLSGRLAYDPEPGCPHHAGQPHDANDSCGHHEACGH